MFIPVFGMGSNFLLGEATYHVAYVCLLFVEVKYHGAIPLVVSICSLSSTCYSVGIWRGHSARGMSMLPRMTTARVVPTIHELDIASLVLLMSPGAQRAKPYIVVTTLAVVKWERGRQVGEGSSSGRGGIK